MEGAKEWAAEGHFLPPPESAVAQASSLVPWTSKRGRLLYGLHRGDGFDVLGQPLAGDVQPPLDRADRGVERVRHLDERLPADVERHERLAVEPAELLQAL